jgi:hypothetical protein
VSGDPSDGLVLALSAALLVVLALGLLVAWLLDQVAQLRAQVDQLGREAVVVVNDNATLRRIMRANGMLPPAPPPLPEERTE